MAGKPLLKGFCLLLILRLYHDLGILTIRRDITLKNDITQETNLKRTYNSLCLQVGRPRA